jgi:hypothetical protein
MEDFMDGMCVDADKYIVNLMPPQYSEHFMDKLDLSSLESSHCSSHVFMAFNG